MGRHRKLGPPKRVKLTRPSHHAPLVGLIAALVTGGMAVAALGEVIPAPELHQTIASPPSLFAEPEATALPVHPVLAAPEAVFPALSAPVAVVAQQRALTLVAAQLPVPQATQPSVPQATQVAKKSGPKHAKVKVTKTKTPKAKPPKTPTATAPAEPSAEPEVTPTTKPTLRVVVKTLVSKLKETAS